MEMYLKILACILLTVVTGVVLFFTGLFIYNVIIGYRE